MRTQAGASVNRPRGSCIARGGGAGGWRGRRWARGPQDIAGEDDDMDMTLGLSPEAWRIEGAVVHPVQGPPRLFGGCGLQTLVANGGNSRTTAVSANAAGTLSLVTVALPPPPCAGSCQVQARGYLPASPRAQICPNDLRRRPEPVAAAAPSISALPPWARWRGDDRRREGLRKRKMHVAE